MSEKPRRPSAFRPQGKTPAAEDEAELVRPALRRPRAFPGSAAITPAVADPFEEEDIAVDVMPPRRRFSFGRIFAAGLGILVSLALWMWADSVIRSLFEHYQWLGWLALIAAGVAALGLIGVLIRELAALRRLTMVHVLRGQAREALATNDGRTARAAVAELEAIARGLPETTQGRAALAALEGEVIDGRDLVRIAESEILRPLDRQARDMVLAAAKRVSVVTAVSPRALVDLGYVLCECARLVRRISTLYGGRPGFLGFLRLTREVVAHLAVTGSVAVGDGIVQQLIGHGLAARVSARLGEGVINGLMTARVGIAAMDVVRPFPFEAERRPRIGDFIADLGGLGEGSGNRATKPNTNEQTNPARYE